jgi:hypothetical protein
MFINHNLTWIQPIKQHTIPNKTLLLIILDILQKVHLILSHSFPNHIIPIHLKPISSPDYQHIPYFLNIHIPFLHQLYIPLIVFQINILDKI